jgi:uncharacterized membrane protein YdcZ (DUF606 family)
MSKDKKLDLETKIVSQIKTGEINMKPRWYFIAGSLLLVSSLVGLSMGVIFLANLSVFLMRKSGPLAAWRIQSILSTFPWWIPVAAIVGVFVAIWLLKKYDISYKKNFSLIVIAFVVSILFAGFLLDRLGLNEHLSRGRMRKFYQEYEIPEGEKGSVKGIHQYNRQLKTR